MSDRDTSAGDLVDREVQRSRDVVAYLDLADFRGAGTLFVHPRDWVDWAKHAGAATRHAVETSVRRDPSLPPGFGEWRLHPGTEAEVRLRFFLAWRCAGCGRRLKHAPEHPPFQFAARCGDCCGAKAEDE